MSEYLPLLIGLLFLSGILVIVLYPIFKQRLGWILSLAPLTIFVLLLISLGDIGTQTIKFLPSDFSLLPGIDFAFRMDGLSAIFGLLITGIGFLVVLYASWYMKKYNRQAHFFSYLMFFMAAMTGLVFSDNLMGLFIFWELTSVTSFLLIGFDHHSEKSRQAALQSLLITGFGGLCLLFAAILIGQIAGTYQISEIIASDIDFTAHPQYQLIFILILVAVLTKSAQFPFSFWLVGAMKAPTPVSAYLHSATMVNAGVYLLAILHPALVEQHFWYNLMAVAGLSTMLVASMRAMTEDNLKRLLAYTTLFALGSMF